MLIVEIKELLSHVDHTLLGVDSTWEDIKKLCDEGIGYGTASVCIPPCYVKQAAEYALGRVKICTVIGFPNGYNSSAVKVYEAGVALSEGAEEIDMVINVGLLKAGRAEELEEEIRAVKQVCGDKILKVIIEACLLTDEEKRLMCRICHRAGADYIKTSTGFSKGGATLADVKLLFENAPAGLKVKAAGGISGTEDGIAFLEAGAERLGTSRIVKALKNSEGEAEWTN